MLNNRNGQNSGVLWLPLKDFLDSERPKANLLTPAGTSLVNIPAEAVTYISGPHQIAPSKKW